MLYFFHSFTLTEFPISDSRPYVQFWDGGGGGGKKKRGKAAQFFLYQLSYQSILALSIYTYFYVTISKHLIVLVGKILGGGGNCPLPPWPCDSETRLYVFLRRINAYSDLPTSKRRRRHCVKLITRHAWC